MEQKVYVDINNTRSEEMRKKWQKMIDDGDDPFDVALLEKYDLIPFSESEHWIAVHNQFPYDGAKVQIILISRKYREHFNELSPEEQVDLFTFADALCKELHINGGGLVMRFGSTSISGGTVKHLHAQLIEPQEDSTVAAWFGAKKE